MSVRTTPGVLVLWHALRILHPHARALSSNYAPTVGGSAKAAGPRTAPVAAGLTARGTSARGYGGKAALSHASGACVRAAPLATRTGEWASSMSPACSFGLGVACA